MKMFEYKVVPAPEKPVKAKGVKPGADRFAHTIEDVLNAHGTGGWDYLRTDMLPSSEKAGIFRGTTTIYRSVLVFRRELNETETPREDRPRAEPKLSPKADEMTPDDAKAQAARLDSPKIKARVSEPPRLTATRLSGTSTQ